MDTNQICIFRTQDHIVNVFPAEVKTLWLHKNNYRTKETFQMRGKTS